MADAAAMIVLTLCSAGSALSAWGVYRPFKSPTWGYTGVRISPAGYLAISLFLLSVAGLLVPVAFGYESKLRTIVCLFSLMMLTWVMIFWVGCRDCRRARRSVESTRRPT